MMWLTAWGVRGSCISADIQDCGPVHVLLCEAFKKVQLGLSMSGLCPGFPYSHYLHNDLDLGVGVLGKGHKTCQQCSHLVLWAAWNACDCSKSLKLSQAHGMDTEAKDPQLAALVISGRSGI